MIILRNRLFSDFYEGILSQRLFGNKENKEKTRQWKLNQIAERLVDKNPDDYMKYGSREEAIAKAKEHIMDWQSSNLNLEGEYKARKVNSAIKSFKTAQGTDVGRYGSHNLDANKNYASGAFIDNALKMELTPQQERQLKIQEKVREHGRNGWNEEEKLHERLRKMEEQNPSAPHIPDNNSKPKTDTPTSTPPTNKPNDNSSPKHTSGSSPDTTKGNHTSPSTNKTKVPSKFGEHMKKHGWKYGLGAAALAGTGVTLYKHYKNKDEK